MSKQRTRWSRSSTGFALCTLLFLSTFISDFFGGGRSLYLFFFWSSVIVFLWTYAQIGSFVIHANLKAWRRFRNKEQVFTNSMFDDEPNLESTDQGKSNRNKHQNRCDEASGKNGDSDTRMERVGLEKDSAVAGDGH